MMTPSENKPTVEEWLDSLDVTTLNMRDGVNLRRIGAALTALEAAEADLTRAIDAAREAGESWSAIGMVLGTSKQAAHRKFGQQPR